MESLEGKNVVITGATSGIGRACALELARRGAALLLISRNRTAGDALAERLTVTSGRAATFIAADLSTMAEVRNAAASVLCQWKTIDILINNAGARFDRFAETPDGTERTFATNHLGHFLFTGLLEELWRAAPAARLITVSSSAAEQAHPQSPWQHSADNYDRRQAYAKSKLANLLFAFELARRLEGTSVRSLAVDPGLVATNFARNNGLVAWAKHLFYHARRRELISATESASSVIEVATNPHLPPAPATTLYRRGEAVAPCPAARNLQVARDLWSLSAQLTGVEPGSWPTPHGPQA